MNILNGLKKIKEISTKKSSKAQEDTEKKV